MKREGNSNTTSIHLNNEKALKITPEGLFVGEKGVSLDGHTHVEFDHTHEEFNHTHTQFDNNLKAMNIEPIEADTYSLGRGLLVWNQVKANYYIGFSAYSQAIDMNGRFKVKRASEEIDLAGVLDDITIDIPSEKIRSSNAADKLWVNVSGLRRSGLKDLFVREEDDGAYVNESSLLALALQEIKDIKKEVQELKNK